MIGRLPAPLLAGAAILLALLVCAVAPGTVAPYDPLAFDFAALLQPPGRAHLFGTDQFGRDILSRTIAAAARWCERAENASWSARVIS